MEIFSIDRIVFVTLIFFFGFFCGTTFAFILKWIEQMSNRKYGGKENE